MTQTERGFTLLEVLIAFIIMSLAFVLLFQGASGGVSNTRIATRTEQAVSLARSKLSSFDADASHDAEDLQGDDGDYHWRLQVVPVLSIPVRPIGRSRPDPTVLYHVAVTISWMTDGRRSTIRLETSRLTPMAPSPS